jgi:DNA-binding protein HU-beta
MAQLGKSELASRIAEMTGTSTTQANHMLSAVMDTISQALANGDEVRLIGFGSFRVLDTKARMGRHPRTGEPMPIAAGKRVAFSAGSSLTDQLKQGGRSEAKKAA